ncbi:Retrovirus-related Pol polyprotein from transposon TNT 1-94 [Gossypium australe]|uniref:Retrovirus-related Pol polyprotein from transposon TNT 1-94 n=1 Tax=Gossypium australe TaxID=47621 RepID=A0A5B6UTR8_9ROSI|nr:Retrovirus-related Pol polyprotein from transposon TNT 1-94 [Gossypium australe]
MAMLRAFSTRRNRDGYERLLVETEVEEPVIPSNGQFEAQLKRARSVPARVFGLSRKFNGPELGLPEKCQEKSSTTTNSNKKGSKSKTIHPLFSLFDGRRKKKTTAKPEFARYIEYLKEGGMWDKNANTPDSVEGGSPCNPCNSCSREGGHPAQLKQTATEAHRYCPFQTYTSLAAQTSTEAAFDLWEVVNSDVEPTPLRANPTVAQIRQHADDQEAQSYVMHSKSCLRCDLHKDYGLIRLLGEQFNEARIVEKVLSILPERIRKSQQNGGAPKRCFQAKTKSFSSTSTYKGKKTWKNRPKPDAARRGDQPCRYCKKPGHSEANCCQNHPKRSQAELRVAEDSSDHEEQVFAVSCSPGQKKASKGWLLDSGCTNHMSSDATIFKTLDRSCKTKVKVGNGQFIKAEGKGDVLICTSTGNKLISNVLLVPEIDRNLLSIAQLLEKGYFVVFKGKKYQITDPNGSRLMSIIMTNKSFEELVENFTNSVEKEKICEVCQLGNQAKLPFPSNQAWRASERLQLSGVAQVFLKFKAAIETETGCKLKTLRSDNGTEYTSAQFQAYCDNAGIKHQLTNVFTHQRNGVEAVNTVVYIQNRLPTKALDHKTPYEAWFRFKPTLAHLKVFGCLCYAHVPIVKRDKLSKRAQPRILVGSSSIKKGYRILDPSTNKIQVSRDAIFDEKACWNWDRNEPEAASKELTADQPEVDHAGSEMDIDDVPIRATRPLAEIYERAQVAIMEPSSFEEAEAHEGWKQAMIDEIKMIEKNQTSELTEKPANKRTIGVKWIYRAKHNADRSLNKLKARLVFKGFSQRYGLDYMETFAPIARLDTIRLLVALATQKQWSIHQLDVRIDNYLISLGFNRSISEPTLYVKNKEEKTLLIVSLYVDDLLVTGGDQVILANFKAKMKDMFEISDLGQMTYFLGMEVFQTEKGIFLGQQTFSMKILKKFSMENSKPTSTPVAVGMKLSSQGDHELVYESSYRSLVAPSSSYKSS